MNTGKNKAFSAKKKFLYYFPNGFADEKYYAWERGYKWDAHLAWEQNLNKEEYQNLLSKKKYEEIALRAVRIETKTNLLFSFEKMALRDAVKTQQGAKDFSEGLFEYIYGKNSLITDLKNLLMFLRIYQENKKG